MKNLITFHDVVKEYGSKDSRQLAVNHIDFTIDEGEFVVILGQSGAGKSTVLNLIGGMDYATSGTITVNELELNKMNEKQLADYRANNIGFIFQFYNLLPTLTALENVAITKDIIKKALDPKSMLEAVGLEKHIHKFPSQLSGGEQQRVSIARALCKNPSLILGDEPTGALDSETGIVVLELLQKMCKENKKTVIIVTHNAAYGKCADKIIYMRNGFIREIRKNDNPLPVNECESQDSRLNDKGGL
jgi:putative ABC transport system ATP-binding protein